MNRILSPLVLTFCFVITAAIAEDDQVYLQKGSGIRGKVIGSTNTQIGIEVKGKNQTLSANEVRLITFGDEPQELRQGRARAIAGKYDTALAELKRVNPAAVEREVVKRDLQFYLALCEGRLALSTGGDKAKATSSMMAFVKAAPKSNHFFDAARLLGDLAVGQGDYANAVKFYGAIASKAPWPDYKMSASLAEAQALVAKGDFPAAEKKFGLVAGAKTDTAESKRQVLLAKIGKARCMAETGSADEAIKMIETVIAENEPVDSELFGRAYNAHGDCLQKAGKAKEALMSYLHVDVLFYSQPEIHAEALYHLSKLWATAKKPDRAAAAKTLLQSRYSGSMWSQKE
jgi:tetratricopeptide (TPR) repeat protein